MPAKTWKERMLPLRRWQMNYNKVELHTITEGNTDVVWRSIYNDFELFS